MTDITRWGDQSQYVSEPMEGSGIHVHLIWMTPDPLGAIAAMSGIYEGKVFRSLTEVTDEERQHYWEEVQKTHLRAPLEAVKLHMMLEGVDRAFTHQLVRIRTAVFAQESLRFAVKENMAEEALVPPSIAALPDTDARVVRWKNAVRHTAEAYEALVDTGIPAEDARSVLPHAATTRIHYITDLRSLTDHAGNRLCTQAQFIWRLAFAKIVGQIRNYGHQLMEEDWSRQTGGHPDDIPISPGDDNYDRSYEHLGGWQFETIADSMLFRPACFHQGRCPFKASFDRPCSIRDKVDLFAERGIESKHWETPTIILGPPGDEQHVPGIQPEEWLMNPDAAR